MKHSKLSKIAAITMSAMIFSQSAFAFQVDFAPGTPLIEALRALGYKAGKNVIINGDLGGTVAMSMGDTDFDTAIKALSLTHNFSYEEVNGAVLIAPQKTMNTIKTFKLKHLEPDYAAKQTGLLVEDDNVVVNSDLHSITVSGSSADLNRVERELEELDKAQQQVNIKATFIELSKGKTRDLGLSYTSDPWTKDTSQSGYNGFVFGVTGAHEETLSNGKVLARPNVTTFDGRQAKIMMGDKVPVFTSSSDSTDTDADTTMTVEYKDVGIQLDVLPRINEEDKETITMVIKPSVSTITEWVESGNNKAPQISERSAETTIRVKSGETILLGGLLKEEEIKNIKQIPILAKIPLLGELFKSRSLEKSQSEIVVAITPTIVYDEDGRPQVEMQKMSPKLHEQLNKMQNEPEESNIDTEAQTVIDTRNNELEIRHAEDQDKLKERESEIEKLQKENRRMKEELVKSQETMRMALDALKEGES